MPHPTQKALIPVLLRVLANEGKPVAPAAIYDTVAAAFSEMSAEERGEEMKSGHNKFNNSVQWVRQRLVESGDLDNSIKGMWHLTPKGTERARQLGTVEGARPTDPEPDFTLIDLLQDHDDSLRRDLRSRLQDIEPSHFEDLCGEILRSLSFRDVTVTQASSDGGIDGYGKLKLGIVVVNAAFQCKRWQKPVGRPEIDAFRGATQGKFDQAIFLTTSSFTSGARAESIRAGSIPIIMIDGDAILDLMIEKELGVKTRPLTIATVDDDYFRRSGRS